MADPVFSYIAPERVSIVLDECRKVLIKECGQSMQEADRIAQRLGEMINESLHLAAPNKSAVPMSHKDRELLDWMFELYDQVKKMPWQPEPNLWTKRLVHYRKTPIGVLERYSPILDNEHKPGGLWLSDESEFGWSSLLKTLIDSNEPEWHDAPEWFRFIYGFDVDLEQILTISTEDELHGFAAKFSEVEHRECSGGFGAHIQWSLVKEQFMGILISPYQESLSYQQSDPQMHWYRFDCASACIWDTSCLYLRSSRLGPA